MGSSSKNDHQKEIAVVEDEKGPCVWHKCISYFLDHSISIIEPQGSSRRGWQEPTKQSSQLAPDRHTGMQPLDTSKLPRQQDPNLDYDAHSPQSTGSPEPPSGVLTDAEAKLWELVLAIHSVQTRFNRPMANGNGINGTATPSHQQLMLAEPVQAILRKMADVDDIASQIGTQLPRQAVEDLDNTHHPGHVVKERIESVALENAFLNGKIMALTSFRDLLGDALADGFPELYHLRQPTPSTQNSVGINGEHGVTIKEEN